MADEDQAAVAAVRSFEAIKARVVGVEGVVTVVYPGGVNSDLQVCVGRVPGSGNSCGAISLSNDPIVHYCLVFVYILSKIDCKLANKGRRRRMLTDVKIDGGKVKTVREERFFSQRELAGKAGINHNTVWRIEGGDSIEVHPRTIRKLAEALSVDPASLTPGQ